MRILNVPRLHCFRCGWVWRPRGTRVRICPRCKSPRWDLPIPTQTETRHPSGRLVLRAPLRAQVRAIAKRHGVRSIRVFGSVARGRATVGSDVDFLVEFRRGHRWERLDLAKELESLLGRKVDIGTPDSLHWLVRPRVLAEAVSI
ncbi:MAG TPA: nucleotidyltransferase family protein [Thermoplasmata archaeon]|nr:nucleotidyltransferase family protein [Thermoplasmata archaeon]